MNVGVKRVYEIPDRSDGTRVLVDRLWPRGVSKENANIDLWVKDLTPSSELRKWFHADTVRRYDEFKKRYRDELSLQKKTARELLESHKKITLITAVNDVEHSHIPTLRSFLETI